MSFQLRLLPLRLSLPVRVSIAATVGLAFSVTGMMTNATAQTAPSTTVPTNSDVIIPTDGSSGSGPIGSTTIPTPIPTTGGVPLSSVRFFCATDNGRPTVMYQPEGQTGSRYAWAVPQQMGGGWTPERRCSEIASRLELYRPDGLVEMQTNVENGYNTVCVTTDKVPSCRIVFTVPKGQDAISTRDQVFQNLAIADSGQRTTGVFTLADKKTNPLEQFGKAIGSGNLGALLNKPASQPATGMYLKPFLAKADGGTGERLAQLAQPAPVPPVVPPVAAPVAAPVVVPPVAAPVKPVVKVPAKPAKGKVFRNVFR